jgi:hypothetical protein
LVDLFELYDDARIANFKVGTDVLDCAMSLKPALPVPALTRHCALAVKSNFDSGKFCKVST